MRDIDLAGLLGYERPANIRKLIRRHHDTLTVMGTLSTVEHVSKGVRGSTP